MTPWNNVSEIERVRKPNGDDDEQDRSHENKKPTPIVAACLGFGFSDRSRPLVCFRIWHFALEILPPRGSESLPSYRNPAKSAGDWPRKPTQTERSFQIGGHASDRLSWHDLAG